MIAVERSPDGLMWVRENVWYIREGLAAQAGWRARARDGGHVRLVTLDGLELRRLPYLPPRTKAPKVLAQDDFQLGR